MKAKDAKKHDSARRSAAQNHSANHPHAAKQSRTGRKEATGAKKSRASSSEHAVKTSARGCVRHTTDAAVRTLPQAAETRLSAAKDVVYKTVIVGGGAAGLFFAARFGQKGDVILERGERVGRKLSATGGGWGNVTNENAGAFHAAFCLENGEENANIEECATFEENANAKNGESGENYPRPNDFFGYFTSDPREKAKILSVIEDNSPQSLRAFLRSIGCETFADERGRVYPTSRQASSLTDCLRIEAARRGVEIKTGEYVTSVQKTSPDLVSQPNHTQQLNHAASQSVAAPLLVQTAQGAYYAENVVLCTGGSAAKNFGSDGNGYALAQTLGHTVTPLYPSIVQLKCAEKTAALKGIRVFDCSLRLLYEKTPLATESGDVLFTDCGVSGDAAFRLSAFLPHDQTSGGVNNVFLEIDFLPAVEEARLARLLKEKRLKYPSLKSGELFVGIINSRVGEKIAQYALSNAQIAAKEEAAALAYTAKRFRLHVTGTLSFDYAQVTKGGVRLSETDEFLQSKHTPHVYFAGEILDVDGACGGYNLQWAYSAACRVGKALGRTAD